jgi:hypothetical protein
MLILAEYVLNHTTTSDYYAKSVFSFVFSLNMCYENTFCFQFHTSLFSV